MRSPLLKRLDRARLNLYHASAEHMNKRSPKDKHRFRDKLEHAALRFAASAIEARLAELELTD